MILFQFLNQYSRSRGAWLLMAIATFVLEIVALWFQYGGIGLTPCVLCIYERCALFGVMVAGLVGVIAPKTLLRYAALTVWLYSAWIGIKLTWRHVVMQLYPSSFMTCDFAARFPSWLPLDKWLPQVFIASSYNDCLSASRQWRFLKLEMPQWLVAIFITYFAIALLVLIAQFYPRKC